MKKKNPFEKTKGGPKAGNKKEAFMEMIQSKKKGMKCGGMVTGGAVRGSGAAQRGKGFKHGQS